MEGQPNGLPAYSRPAEGVSANLGLVAGFRFTGKIAKLTFKLGPVQLGADDRRHIQHVPAKAKDQLSDRRCRLANLLIDALEKVAPY
jgi:hypothetical protein